MIDVTQETLIPYSELPGWTAQRLSRRIHPSTLHRWRLRGVRGVRLETVLIGGTRYTSTEALSRFFAAITAVADGQSVKSYAPADPRQDAADEAFLATQGIYRQQKHSGQHQASSEASASGDDSKLLLGHKKVRRTRHGQEGTGTDGP